MEQNDLSGLTLKELWQLFPITLTAPCGHWRAWFREEKDLIGRFVTGARISHIGSTAIPDIWAKPIVDILLETAPEAMGRLPEKLAQAGYRLMSQSENRLSFNKGYTPAGFAPRVFHLHARAPGDHDELYFRDYLTDHPETAKEYEALKLSLWKPYEHNRNGYTNAKAGFVGRYTREAKALYAGRYEG